ncbi:MAG: hypothetical protein HYT99_01930 [Candidatus Tectomicrobia bacterium]|nr:hypothetical protein [Candidatus Tectomicrobia bacterium]
MDKAMDLGELFRQADVPPLSPIPAPLAVTGVVESTAEVAAGGLFVARKGETHDGHQFLGEAVRRGARAAVVERKNLPPLSIPLVRVRNSREALGKLCAAFSPPSPSPWSGCGTAARPWESCAPPSTASPRTASS